MSGSGSMHRDSVAAASEDDLILARAPGRRRAPECHMSHGVRIDWRGGCCGLDERQLVLDCALETAGADEIDLHVAELGCRVKSSGAVRRHPFGLIGE